MITSFLVTILAAGSARATDDCSTDAMIVFDGSESMIETGFNNIDVPRILEARRAMADAVPAIAQNRHLGLVIYGPNGLDNCSGLELRFPPIANAAGPIIDAVNALQPGGGTAFTEAVRMAAEVLSYKTRPATILLVTDGNETCGGEPCILAAELEAEGVDTTVHVIGFKVRGSIFSWDRQEDGYYDNAQSVSRCLAERTGGTYAKTETLDQLVAALRASLGCNILF